MNKPKKEVAETPEKPLKQEKKEPYYFPKLKDENGKDGRIVMASSPQEAIDKVNS